MTAKTSEFEQLHRKTARHRDGVVPRVLSQSVTLLAKKPASAEAHLG